MRNRIFPLATFPFLAIVFSGCGGSSQQGTVGGLPVYSTAIAGRADVVGGSGDDGSTVTADSVPVTVKISAEQGDVPFTDVISYSVYRQPNGSSSDATLFTTQQFAGALLVFDNSLSVGSRADYKIVLNYTTGNASDGTPILKSKTLPLTDYVTQIEPTENADVTPAGTGVVNVSVPATLGADDYVLDVSATSDFNRQQQFTPSSKGPYTAPVDSPRHGTTVMFGAINVAQAFPGATTLYLRIGARDSRNGSTFTTNPDVFTDPQQFSVP